MKKKCVAMMLIAIMTASLAGCGSSKDGSGKSVKLDSDHPVSLTIWHYYNGAQQAMFDTLVKEFNASVEKRRVYTWRATVRVPYPTLRKQSTAL